MKKLSLTNLPMIDQTALYYYQELTVVLLHQYKTVKALIYQLLAKNQVETHDSVFWQLRTKTKLTYQSEMVSLHYPMKMS